MKNNLDDIEISQVIETLGTLNISIDKLKSIYPKILEKTIPLSKTGVHPRTYFDWKEKGLVESVESEGSWIRLNLIDFCWITVIVQLRQFGVSIKNLLALKESVLSEHVFSEMLNHAPEILKDLEENSSFAGKKFGPTKNLLRLFISNIDSTLVKQMKIYNQFASAIGNVLITNNKTDIVGYLDEGESLKFFLVTHGDLGVIKEPSSKAYDLPRLVIPLRPIVESIFANASIEKYTYSLGLLNDEERGIIELIREGDFKELIIGSDQGKRSIHRVKEKNVLNEQAAEIQKIFGMNKYDEVTVKFRNKKDLFIRNKRKIK
jgi:hypothetical protein